MGPSAGRGKLQRVDLQTSDGDGLPMGMEYSLRFQHSAATEIATVLRREPMVGEPAANGIDFELRSPETTGAMPDAWMSIEPGGLYFCDNGGAGRRFLGAIIVDLVEQFGPVTVEERE